MESLKFINIGYGNLINANRVIAIVSPESAPIKRIIQEAKEKGLLLMPLWAGKPGVLLLWTVVIVVLSSIMPETVGSRLGGNKDQSDE